MTALELTMTNFNALPRELRDQIYGQVFVSPRPIQFSNVLGPMVCDPDLLGPMRMLFDWASTGQIADEACEIFYQRNTFLVHCEDLPTFLGANIHRMLSVDVGQSMHQQEHTCVRSFDTKEWVTNMIVVIEQDNTKYSRYLAYELKYLLECPRLRKLTIKTGRTTLKSWEKEWKGILKELRLKIGNGLKVFNAEQPWFDFPHAMTIRVSSTGPVWEEGDDDGDGDFDDPGEEVGK